MTKFNKPVNIVLLGAPGAGKGTQAGILIKEYGLLHVSTGDMLRAAIKEGSETGLKAQEFMNKGELVPDKVVTQLVIDRMGKDDAVSGVILDGFPRTKPQAEALDSALASASKSLDDVIYMKVTEDVVMQRLTGRRMCTQCGKIYHVVNMPPKEEGVCDDCGAALYQRDDDKPETVKNRLDVYGQSTKDLIDYYREKGLLREVDGDLPAEKLFEDIDSLFRSEGLINDDPQN